MGLLIRNAALIETLDITCVQNAKHSIGPYNDVDYM